MTDSSLVNEGELSAPRGGLGGSPLDISLCY